MESIFIREKEDMVSCDATEITEKMLFEFFLNDTHRTMYVTERIDGIDKLVGIITLGNFRRNQMAEQELINYSFTKFDIQHENDAMKILEEKEKIWSVPIVDENGRIVKEYYKTSESSFCIDFNLIRQIYSECMMTGNHKIIFVIDEVSPEEMRESSSMTNENFVVIDSKVGLEEFSSLCQNNEFSILDLTTELFKVRELIYRKYHVDYRVISDAYSPDFDYKTINEIMTQRSKLCNNIAIFDLEPNILKEAVDYNHLLDSNKLIYDNGEYKYSEVEGDIECIMMLYCPFTNPYIIIDGKYIPILSPFYSMPSNERIAADCDIAFNIIPKLLTNDVQCIVINNLENEQEKISCLDWDEVGSRNYDILSCHSREAMHNFGFDSPEGKRFRNERRQSKVVLINGFLQYANTRGEYVNFFNGERYTYNNPTKFENTLFLFGPCVVRGYFVDDKHTLGSYLRDMIDKKYYIKNCGLFFQSTHWIMRSNKYKSGDIVIIFAYCKEPYERNNIRVDSVIQAYKEVPDLKNHVWEHILHCDKLVTKHIADKVYNLCEEHHCFDNNEPSRPEKYCSFGKETVERSIPDGLQSWLTSVEKYKVSNTNHAGAIVMNCNPFTRGHRYLIEQASQQVDILYIFVVEENKSFFDFADRLEMVKLGVCDIKNVVVIPSGRYIISTVTLPGYFEKETNPFAGFDATEDLELFADVIAKKFDIKTRFAGEEPMDAYTNHYNESMRRILPEHGVEFIEIPRISIEKEIVSASLVRKYMKERKFEKIRKLVLPEIYEYLQEHYMD